MILLNCFFPAVCLAQDIFRGGEVILSTRYEFNTVLSYKDTVLVFARSSSNENNRVYSLEPGSSVWDSASVIGRVIAHQSQREAFFAGASFQWFSPDSIVNSIWTCKTAKNIVFLSRDTPNAPHKTYHVSALTSHPYLPGVLIAENRIDDTEFRNDYIVSAISQDGGNSWRNVGIPRAQQFYYSFDPHSLNTVMITRKDGPSTATYFGLYTTTDLFSSEPTYKRLDFKPETSLIGTGFGMWSGIGSVEQGLPNSFNGAKWTLLSDSLYLPPNSAPALVTLPWRENARRAFYPDLDTATEKFRYWSAEMAYHIDHPKLLLVSFLFERHEGTLYENSILVGASHDLGETWTLIADIPFHDFLNPVTINKLAIDPKGPTLYLAVTRMIDDPLSPGERIKVSQVVRWKQPLTSVSGETHYQSPFTVNVAPNPLGGNEVLRFKFGDPANKHVLSARVDDAAEVTLYSTLGVNVGTWRIGSEGNIPLPGLAAGVYQVRAMREGRVAYTSFVVDR